MMSATAKAWIAVASAEHVRIGRAKGFMQVCHGKVTPLRRLSPGDHVVYYSPTQMFRGQDKLQAFTAIGVVSEGVPYQADMGTGFRPFRRDVKWAEAQHVPIRPLLSQLDFASKGKYWGYWFRFGLFQIDRRDFEVIACAMAAVFEGVETHSRLCEQTHAS